MTACFFPMDTSAEVPHILFILVAQLLVFTTECLFYGIYVALMTVCWSLVRTTEKTFHLGILLALFGLSTAHLVLSAVAISPLLKAAFNSSSDYHQIFSDFRSRSLRYDTIGISIFMTSNIVVGCLLLYRCCMIWGTHPMKYIVALPSLLLLLTIASAISALVPVVWNAGYSTICQVLFYAATLSENVLVTCLLTWRIWQVKRKARDIVSQDLQRRYSTAISIIVQSGIIYPIFIITYIIFAFNSAKFPLVRRIVFACLTQLVGIMPTWIIVRGAIAQQTRRGTVQSMFAPQTPVVPRLADRSPFEDNAF